MMTNWAKSTTPPKTNAFWRLNAFSQVQTRILLLYASSILLLTAASLPIFRALHLTAVDRRVREHMLAERAAFLQAYETWEQAPSQGAEDLKAFADGFLASNLPEDDNFYIFLIDNELYRSNPDQLLELLHPQSKLFNGWQNLTQFVRGKHDVEDPEIGSILYKADPLELDGEIRGTFVIAHTTAGEHREALNSVLLAVRVTGGVLLISFILAWVASGRILSPVRMLAATAQAISESDLSQRIAIPETKQATGELAELAETFNNMMDRLQKALDSQRNFMNDAGHELRTPITIIQGHLELMGDDPQERQETLEIVFDEIDRMSRLVNDMILLAKSERPNFLAIETIEVDSFTQDLFAKTRTLADRKWILKREGKGLLAGDRQRLTGAILNLINNSIRHTQVNDEIELGTICTSEAVQFWVRDTGEGIAPADQTRIFERFTRAANRRRAPDGSGLGLAIVRAVIEAHGGRVELVSTLGSGSTFTLILPKASPKEKRWTFE